MPRNHTHHKLYHKLCKWNTGAWCVGVSPSLKFRVDCSRTKIALSLTSTRQLIVSKSISSTSEKHWSKSKSTHVLLMHIKKYKPTNPIFTLLESDPHFKYRMRKGNPKTHQNSPQSYLISKISACPKTATRSHSSPTSKSCMTPWAYSSYSVIWYRCPDIVLRCAVVSKRLLGAYTRFYWRKCADTIV